jgi:predicted nucleic-acid-binding protein
MIGLDTNVLVRYLTQDDAAQSQQATELLERRLSEANPGFISLVAMAELVWVLDRAYRMAARQIAGAIERILQTEVFVIEKEQEVFAAMIVLRQGGGSFADALIAELGLQAGCSYTLTFDIKAARLPGFKLV